LNGWLLVHFFHRILTSEEESPPIIDLSASEAYTARYPLTLNDFLKGLSGNEGTTGVKTVPSLQMQEWPTL
jgi:hypothetical protein